MNLAQKHTEIAEQWFAAFNEHHLDNLLALYAEHAQHFSPKLKIRQPETKGWVSGKPALKAWWQDAFDRLPSLTYIPSSFTANEKRVIMEYTRKVQGAEDMQIAEVLEIENGLIIASRVYHG